MAHFEVAMPHLTPQAGAMVALMRYTGMRPIEVVQMRLSDISMTARTWTYSPRHYKTEDYDTAAHVG